MLHYFFGPPDRQLFGVYHPADITRDKIRCVLICNAFGHEYLRSHWAMRQIAIKLAIGGYHVLRFDYSCTGDSAGSVKDSDVEQWIKDVETAISELQDISGKEKVDIIGLRLGTWFALKAAKKIKEIKKIVLWDPVVSGHDYVLNLQEIYKLMCIRGEYFIKEEPIKISTKMLDLPEEFMGLCTKHQIVDEIKRIDIIDLLPSLQNETFVVLSSIESKLSTHFHSLTNMDNLNLTCKACEDLIDWRSYWNLGNIIYPNDSIQYLCRDIF